MKPLGVAALLLLVAAAALAQSVPTAEFGRASGGEIGLPFKQSGAFSGSLGFTLGSSKGFDGTVGGSMFGDRLSFFATGQRERFVPTLPQLPARSFSLQTNAIVSSHSTFSATVSSQQRPAFFTHW